MNALEKQLQWHLAVILGVVMLLIWLIGSQLPRNLPDLQALHQQGYDCVAVMQDATSGIVHRQHRFKWLFPMLASAGIGLVLMAQHLVIRRTFRRLDSIRVELRQLEAGQIQQLSTHVPLEIAPMIQEFNRLLQVMQERLERSRHALGNLAHALKGPLNLLMQYLDGRDAHDVEAQQARLQAERIHHLMQRELKRARLAGLGHVSQRFQASQDLPDLIAVLHQLYQSKNCQIQSDVSPDLPSLGDREDMLELLGNLLDNACKWATTQVRCQLRQDQQQLHIRVEDDGLPLSVDDLNQLSERGVRLDETVEGHGLGLAICKDIVKLYGGTLAFAPASLGGLRVDVMLPIMV